MHVQGLASVDFVIEAVRESEDIKRSVFMRLDQVAETSRHLSTCASHTNLVISSVRHTTYDILGS